MKSILFTIGCIFALILISFKTTETTDKHTIEGIWELVDQYTYDGENVVDTIETSEGYRQIKMYTDGKVMWTRFVPQDSVEWFGYGSYIVTDSSLIETLEYGSASMMQIIDTMRVFTFKLDLKDDYYSQITLDSDGDPIFSENYKRIGPK
ncbi:hypothetical protein [Robertkochia aurantiaca]|uniref:hypothetical protein n=1 Tax=Robertkochia aurantiaca TaxID=2873700 RepID=UPI001CCE9776|nr:hypothetical protein [Robertkochia sp. 3YJGBD-33]